MKKFLGVLFGILFLISLVSAFEIGLSPSELMEDEWVVFFGIFVVVFALVYLALTNFFTQKSKGKYPWSGEKSILQNKGAIAIIALVIALFTASAFVQQGWMYGLFGEAMTAWLFLFTFAFMIVLMIPFCKIIKEHFGSIPANIFFFVIIWVIVKFGFDPSNLDLFYSSNLSYDLYEFYDLVTNKGFLYLGIIIIVVFGAIKKVIKKQ